MDWGAGAQGGSGCGGVGGGGPGGERREKDSLGELFLGGLRWSGKEILWTGG